MNENIIYLIKTLFIKKECDITSIKVIAAIITAASGIAHCSSIITPSEIEQMLLVLLNANDNAQANELLGMEYEDVKNIIGYEINFRDLNQALNEFEKNKEQYERLFSTIKEKSLTNKQNI